MPKTTCHGSQKRSFFETCSLQLRTWIYDLPSDLRLERLDEDSLPHAFTLHMVYNTVCILLCRPYLSPKNDVSIVKKAKDLLHSSAKQICAIARKNRRAFGSFRQSPITATHCTLSAALVLIQQTDEKRQTSIADDISICLQVLDELSTAWDTARRIRANLVKLIRTRSAQASAVENDHDYTSRGALSQSLATGIVRSDSQTEIQPPTRTLDNVHSPDVGPPLADKTSWNHIDGTLENCDQIGNYEQHQQYHVYPWMLGEEYQQRDQLSRKDTSAASEYASKNPSQPDSNTPAWMKFGLQQTLESMMDSATTMYDPANSKYPPTNDSTSGTNADYMGWDPMWYG